METKKTRRSSKDIIREEAQKPLLQELGYNYIRVLDSMPARSAHPNASKALYLTSFHYQRMLEQDLHKREGLKYSIRLTKEQLGPKRIGGTLYLYVEKEFYDFVRIIEEEAGIKKHAKEIAWETLKTASIHYLAQGWEKEYGHYFQDAQNYTLDEMIEVTCNIDELISPTGSIYGIDKFMSYLIEHGFYDVENIFQDEEELYEKVTKKVEDRNFNILKRKVTKPVEYGEVTYSIHDIDMMNGTEFEQFVALLFKKMGYLAKTTKASADQGIDVIAEKMGKKIGIQTKCYSDKVGNSAVQQVVAGLSHYNCSKGIVITNNYFTDAAKVLAQSNNVILWDREKLNEKISELF